MIWFILWYCVFGIALGVIGIIYAVWYMDKKGLSLDEMCAIKDHVIGYIGLSKIYPNISKALQKVLDIVSFMILPFLCQFGAYLIIKDTDQVLKDKVQS